MDSEILEEHGLTPLEQDVVRGVRYEHFEPVDGLALYTFGEMRAFSTLDAIPTADEYREVLLGLINKGWLTIITDLPETRAARYAAKGIQVPPLHSLADTGCIDFTPQGYHCYRQLVRAKGSPSPETLEWADEDACTLNCIAGTKRTCQDWLKELLDPFRGGLWGFWYPVRSIGVVGPERVGPWKPREAAPTYPRGWHIALQLKRVRRRRFSLPEWNVEGWITPEEHLSLDGEIEGVRFHFWDGVISLHHSQNPPIPLYQASLTIRDGALAHEKPVYTTLNGAQAVAYTEHDLPDTHFRWKDAKYRTKPLTISEALDCLQEGFVAWKRVRSQA